MVGGLPTFSMWKGVGGAWFSWVAPSVPTQMTTMELRGFLPNSNQHHSPSGWVSLWKYLRL